MKLSVCYIATLQTKYNVSKEAIYAQTNKLRYSNSAGEKLLESEIQRLHKMILETNTYLNEM